MKRVSPNVALLAAAMFVLAGSVVLHALAQRYEMRVILNAATRTDRLTGRSELCGTKGLAWVCGDKAARAANSKP